ncbi:nurim homolog [Cephus cinctus]|uniref:Nuclear envelope membrane protein n=1 Tax=Cephus cinctus TaxID=211228 RepID=A0AAJ7BHY6_CEPCN|nr:nurim homolog [Cephus cinctus]XP_015585947.1 nurim homolog [Cephus cinctus]
MISKSFSIAVCTSSFLYTFYILCNLMYFLSTHNENQKTLLQTTKAENLNLSTTWALLMNACLLSSFMLQHSVMASNYAKEIYSKLDIQDLERSIYNASSAAVLHLLMRYWQSVPWVSIWDIDTAHNNTLWLVFSGFHVLGWFIVYSGCLMMDISELAGLKQVYYKISARPSPMAMKSLELQRYYAHMRHPSFSGFLIILWLHPFMTVDRFLLATIVTLYMVLMWSIDENDYNYHANVIRRKRLQLS